MAKRYKDKFRDWNLYHKSVAAFVAALFVSVIYHAIIVYDGAFEYTDERIIEAPASEIWKFVTDNKNRVRWQGELILVNGLSIEEGRSRMLYWQRVYKRWRSWEQTTELVQERLFRSVQETDDDTHWWSVELEPLGECSTRVIIRDIIRPNAYEDRFWFFRRNDAAEDQRLEVSFNALERWTAGKDAQEKSCQT